MHMEPQESSSTRHSFWSAFLIGIGLMAAVDEIIFHQILAWHHFYDQSTPLVGLMSDGFLHAAELIAIVGGFFWFSDIRRRGELVPAFAKAGFFLGAGAFQVFDGIVDHKILRIHQIRYDVESILPYDLAWNGFGLLLILFGLFLYRSAKRRAGPLSKSP